MYAYCLECALINPLSFSHNHTVISPRLEIVGKIYCTLYSCITDGDTFTFTVSVHFQFYGLFEDITVSWPDEVDHAYFDSSPVVVPLREPRSHGPGPDISTCGSRH